MTLIAQKDISHKEALDEFLRYCHIKSYPSKATIIRPGDAGDRLYFIIDGSVSICVEDEAGGQELVLAYLNKNEFIGEIGVFKGTEIRKVSVKTRCACRLAEVAYDRFRQLLKRELLESAPELLFMLGKQLSSRLLITSRKFCDLAFMDVEGRIARTLLDLCKEPDAMTHPDGMQLRITRQEIGRIVGCSREMAGRVLKELEDKQLITAHGKTIVVFGTR
jgi:CRP/FNR family transcriptional regulator, cyclic AMP receptor protein